MRLSMRRVLVGLIFSCGTVALPASGSPPGRGDPERGFFVPNAGYLRTVRQLELKRRLTRSGIAAAPARSVALAGVRRVPTILVEFSNVDGPFPPPRYQEGLFDDVGPDFATRPVRRTVTQFYMDMSHGQLEVAGDVVGWYRTPEDDSHYENGDHGAGLPFGDLLRFGLEQADLELDFGLYDNDGPDGQPNSGDDDGKVDLVFFIQPEAGAECQSPETEKNIWSHFWHYSDASYGHSAPFTTGDLVKDRDGHEVPWKDGEPKRIVVEDYTIQPGMACPKLGQAAELVEMGVFAHEFGHALGIPDLYDRTPTSPEDPDSFGVGNWEVMAGGSWGFSGTRPDRPTRLGPWSLARLGWADVRVLTKTSTIELEPVNETGRVYAIDLEPTGKEYFLIEHIDPSWQDPTGRRFNWDEHMPAEGLAIWHVDDRVGAASPSWPFAPLDQGQNDAPSLPGRPKHSLVALVQADCDLALEKKTSHGDGGDLYTTGQEFRHDGVCAAEPVSYAGQLAPFTLRDINLATLTAQVGFSEDVANGAPDAAGGPSPTGMAAADQPPEAERGAAGAAVTEAGTEAAAGESAAAGVAPAGATARGALRANRAAVVETHREVAAASVLQSRAPQKTARSPRESATVRQLERIDRVMEPEVRGVYTAGSVEQLAERSISAGQRSALQRATPAQVQQTVSLEKQAAVQAFLARERSVTIRQDTQPASAPEAGLLNLRMRPGVERDIQAQYAPDRSHWDHIERLQLPKVAPSLDADARLKLDELRPLVTPPGVELRPAQETLAGGRARHFEQVVRTRGATLPVLSSEVSLYYDREDHLVTVTAETVAPAELEVTGDPGKLSYGDARAIATEQLGLPEAQAALLRDAGEGIYLPADDPAQARVVRQLSLPVGPGQRDLTIVVDEASDKVLEIK